MIKFIALAFAVLLLMGISGIGLSNVANIFTPAEMVTVNGQQCELKQGIAVIPQIGYYECKQMQTSRRVFTVPSGTGLPACGQNEYAPQCEYLIECPKGDRWFFGLDMTITRLRYTIDKGSQAGEHKLENLECSEGQTVKVITLNRGESISYIAWETWDLLHGWYIPDSSTITIKMKWTPYGLYRYGPNSGAEWVNKKGCYVSSYNNLYVSGDEPAPNGLWNGKSYLDFDGSTNYLEGWAFGPVEYNYIKGADKYNGKYCAGGKIYDTGYIKTSSGCYIYPKNLIATVQCCPNERAGNSYCGKDFKWHESVKEQCISDISCNGQGTYITDYSDPNRKTLLVGHCINGQCQYDKKVTECASSEACPSDMVCVIDKYKGTGKCMNQGQVQPLPIKEVRGESKGSWDIPTLVGNLIAAFIVGGIISAIILAVLFIAFPPARFILSNKKTAILAWLSITLILMFLFTNALNLVAGELF